MKRRDFIKGMGAGVLALSAPIELGAKDKNSKHITILHTNDTHSHIDPMGADDIQSHDMGGVAKRATLIDKIRQENPNTLLFDAGDIFQGTPYFNYYGGELEIKLMSMLGYDAATMGNHDFDNGVDGFYAQLHHAKFPFICSNYDFSNTVLEGQTQSYKVFEKSEVRVGVYGLGIELEGLVDKAMSKETKWLDPVGISQDMETKLKEELKCDIVVCISHLGYKYGKEEGEDKISDLKIAGQTKYTDLIIGGHTHTFLKRPDVVKNKEGRDILVNQVGCYGINLGRIDFYLDSKTPASGVSIEVK